MQDIAGKELAVGDSVAYCAAGKSSDMRVGKVLRFTKKQVEVEFEELIYNWELRQHVPVMRSVFRNSENVAKV